LKKHCSYSDHCTNCLPFSWFFSLKKWLLKKKLAKTDTGLGATEGALLSLFGLFVAFAFGMTTDRFRTRRDLVRKLREAGVPVIWPIEGYAVCSDAAALYPHIPLHEYPGFRLWFEKLICRAQFVGWNQSR
jgi:tryptophanase